MEITKNLRELMIDLRLSGIIPTLEERMNYAKQNALCFDEFLQMIFYDEWERRQNRLLAKKMKRAGVDDGVQIYDWKTTTKYDRELVKRLMSLDFIEKKYNVLIFGPTGVGKTFIGKHLAFLALKTGFEVTFVRSDKMFKHLFSSLVDGTHERTLKFYIKPQLLIIDDFATKAMTREEASDLYEIILERYEKKSTIVTSARAVDEWQPLFPDPILGNSVLDRLAHSSYQILMEGESIRKQKRPK